MASGSSVSTYLPALSRETLVGHYIPLAGAASHAFIGAHILSPEVLADLCPAYDLAIANSAVIKANIGIGLWLYHRHHMRKVANRTRVMYAVYGSSLLNFGSILLWAFVKGMGILPKNAIIRTLFAGLTSLCLLSIGKEYMSYIDVVAADVGSDGSQ